MNSHLHLAVTRFELHILAAMFILIMGWLCVGRRVKPPPDEAARTHFTSSRAIPAFFAGFSLCMAATPLVMGIDFLFFESDAGIGGHGIRLAVGIFVILFALLWIFGVKLFAIQALWPNRLQVEQDGLVCRINGCVRRWCWDEIADVDIGPGKSDTADVRLLLSHDDPGLARHFQRLRWLPWSKKANLRHVSLGCQWKPVALEMSGQQAVCAAIRQGLDRHRAEAGRQSFPP
jgi:hypothetical protein